MRERAQELTSSTFVHGPDDLRTKLAARQMASESATVRKRAQEAAHALAIAVRSHDIQPACGLDLNMNLAVRASRSAARRGFMARHGQDLPVVCPSLPEPEEEPASSHLAARQRFLVDHVTLTEEERLANAFLYRPRFEKRCDFCGGRHCSPYAKGTKIINCKKFGEQQEFSPNRRICDYRRCSEPQRHHTTVCPTLHRRCTVCRYRGHEKNCDLSNPSVMSVLRADFEAAACHGVLTRTRVDDPVWGWYDMPPTAPRNTRFVDYGKITEMDVFEAISFVRSLFADPSVTSGNPADPETIRRLDDEDDMSV